MALDLVSAEQYCHAPLPFFHWIRLLLLAPALNLEDPLMCSMTSTSLSEPCEYTALSYSWAMEDGDASLCRSLWVDGKHLHITQNLFEGLLRLRNTAQPLTLWIDAVCINQDDQLERNSQVAQMAKVYRLAWKVICWLGEGDNSASDQHAASILRRLAQCARESYLVTSDNVRAFVHGPKEDWCEGETVQDHSRCKELSHSTPLPEDSLYLELEELYAKDADIRSRALDACRVMCEFFGRRYWKRRWIVQEIVNSCELSWAWGMQLFEDVRLTEDHIRNLWHMMGALKQPNDYLWEEPIRTVLTLTRMNNTMNHRTGHDNDLEWDTTLPESEILLLVALQEFDTMECATPLDRVYSLIGLSPEQCLVVPEYNLSMDQVCHRFASALIRLDLGRIILAHFQACPPPLTPQKLPSWVPDLRGKFVGRIEGLPRFETPDFHATLSSDGRSLITTVYRLGSYGEDFTSRKGPGPEQRDRDLSFWLHDNTEVQVHTWSSHIGLTHGDMAYVLRSRLLCNWILVLRPSGTGREYRLLFAKFATKLYDKHGRELWVPGAMEITLPESRKERITII